ncbi:MAG: hypothetical protein RL375_3193 [Pseudomonadota bacterium]|jgi:hypothetical protein
MTHNIGLQLSAIAVAAMLATNAQAFQIDTGNPDMKVSWENTVRYSTMFRVDERSPGLSRTVLGPTGVTGPNNINQDDGNNNFGRGIVSNRVDLLSELDVRAGRVGARLSGAGWHDRVYNGSTDNTTTTSNSGNGASGFPTETAKVMGQKAELLDAFVFGGFDLGDLPVTVRLGRHTLLWGESLFFGSNGISGGQAPLDLVKLTSVPNSTFKEIARPTGKLSGQMQLSSDVSVGAYIAYEWEKTRLVPVGAYLSGSDSLGPGGERINAGPTGVFLRQPDVEASNSGQGGVQLRWRVNEIDTDLGFYAIRYHANGPSNAYTRLSGTPPTLRADSYRWVYHEGIEAFGASFAKTIAEWGLAGEVSYRKNTPLASSGHAVIPAIGVGVTADNKDNPGYAVGETAHLQFSWLASLGPNALANESSFVGEIAWNKRVKVTKNPQMLNPNADKTATAVRTVFSPSYRQALPGLDLTPSVGLGYTWGKSSAVGPAFGPDKGGDINFGLGAVYLGSWNANINYVRYLGPEGSTLDNASLAQFKQSLKDRDFISLSLRTTF